MSDTITKQLEDLGYEIEARFIPDCYRTVGIRVRLIGGDNSHNTLLLRGTIYPDNSSMWSTLSSLVFKSPEHAEQHTRIYKEAMLLANRLRPDDREIEMEAAGYAEAISVPVREAIFTEKFADEFVEFVREAYRPRLDVEAVTDDQYRVQKGDAQ